MSSTAADDLRAENLELRRALMATRGELLKAQIVAATRNDVIRLLGYISNRKEIPDLSALLPDDPHMRAALARELRALASNLRERAQKYDAITASLG
jgi:hypothetical protein